MSASAARASGVADGPQWSQWQYKIRGERPSPDGRALELWGYAGQPSYAPGETLTLHVSTTADRFAVTIHRDGGVPEVVHHLADVPGQRHKTPADAFARGCGWPASVKLEIPHDWRPGGYVVELTASDARGETTQDAFFVVRPREPGRDAPIAVVLATYTWQAYNDWGGGSHYSADAVAELAAARRGARMAEPGELLRSGEGFSPRLSFDRPWGRGLIRLPACAPRMALREPPPPGWAVRHEHSEWANANGYSHWCGCAGWASYDGLFARWAERNGYAIELLTQWDLDRDPAILGSYACVVTLGHDEYWTVTGRRALDDFVEAGGRYARFAGNIFWRIRLEDELRTQVCFKYVPEQDPLGDVADASRRTGAFEDRAIADPPVTTFGANGTRGSYSRFGGCAPRGVGGFVVYRNDHWAFAGTDLYYADVLGADVPLVGYEADGVAYTFANGLPLPTGLDGAPPELQILALTPVTFEEEDHGIPGSTILVGDGDVAVVARALHGDDTPETRERVKRGSAVITWMPKGDGEVLCCGTTEWPWALMKGAPMVTRITTNVLDRFAGRS